jgi:soluble epoxide hydrolase / lipid-phosphate phosphatase
VQANRDMVLKPELSQNMGKYLPNLTRREVNGTHWLLWQKPAEVNAVLKEWMENVVSGNRSKL